MGTWTGVPYDGVEIICHPRSALLNERADCQYAVTPAATDNFGVALTPTPRGGSYNR